MKAFRDVINLLEDYKKQCIQEGDPEVIKRLKDIRDQVLYYAAENKTPKNITMNQLEGFAGAIYYNRKMVRGTSKFLKDMKKYQGMSISERTGKEVNHAPKDRRGKRGWSAAMHAIRDYVPSSDGYVLFFTNAVWYSAIHETWGLPVLSQATQLAVTLVENEFNVNVGLEFFNYGYKEQ